VGSREEQKGELGKEEGRPGNSAKMSQRQKQPMWVKKAILVDREQAPGDKGQRGGGKEQWGKELKIQEWCHK